MAATYPYISSAGPLVKVVDRFRKQFPTDVTADTLKRLGIAPKNESYVINILRFVGVIDEDGKRVEAAAKSFFLDDEQFQSGFEQLVSQAYKGLFNLWGDDAWTRTRDELTSFFRGEDATSDVVGGRQALTFLALASLAGHGEVAVPRTASAPTAKKKKPKAASPSSAEDAPAAPVHGAPQMPAQVGAPAPVGLTVRVEVNLPATSDQAVYDAIFQSIRKNLIDVA